MTNTVSDTVEREPTTERTDTPPQVDGDIPANIQLAEINRTFWQDFRLIRGITYLGFGLPVLATASAINGNYAANPTSETVDSPRALAAASIVQGGLALICAWRGYRLTRSN